MKNLLGILSLLGIMVLAAGQANAQRISATLNFSSFDIDEVSSGNTNIDYQGSSTVSLNLRYYTDNKWAFRLGAGVDNLNYSVGDGLTTDYNARRQDLKGIFGLEKHFIIGNFLDIYPGAYIPVVVVGEDIIENNYDNITNGTVRSGLGVLMGANIRFLKIFRLGVEFDASYDNFKEAVWQGANDLSTVPIRGINYTTAVTLGIAL